MNELKIKHGQMGFYCWQIYTVQMFGYAILNFLVYIIINTIFLLNKIRKNSYVLTIAVVGRVYIGSVWLYVTLQPILPVPITLPRSSITTRVLKL